MNKKIVITGICVFSCLVPFKALGAGFSQMYVFGDSLSDEGNTFKGSGNTIPPSPPYFQGRISNGKIWTEFLAEDLGLTSTKYTDVLSGSVPTQGINFAFAGATTGTENTLSLTFPQLPTQLPGLTQEIGAFTTYFAATADPNALYIIWAGANNYLPNAGTYTPQTTPTQAITDLSNSIQALAGVGAKNILVANLPDLGKIPATLNTPVSGSFDALSAAHNSQLSSTVNSLEQTLPVNFIELLDINTLFDQITANPSQYGFTNTTEACFTTTVCSTPDQYFFWDTQHPTTKGHQLISDLASTTLEAVPEPTTVLGLLSFSTLALRLRKKA